MAENENKDLNKPNQNQSGNSNAQNGQNGNRAPRRRPAPRRNAKPAAEGETQAANAAPRKPRGEILRFITLAHETFTSYIIGQITEAFILGFLCGTGMFILRLPYALMTGVIVGASALIPVMGAYIGAIVGAFLIVTISPLKAVEFVVYLAILQQIEGNVIYPRVVGGSIGLPGIWVLAAVSVGGGLLGIPGMLIGVPLTATVYKWIRMDVSTKLQAEAEATQAQENEKNFQ